MSAVNDEYSQKSGQIRNLASLTPDQAADHLAQTHNILDSVAPNIAPHIHSTAVNAITFLNSKLPTGGNELLQDKLPTPSRAQKMAWLDLHQAVSNPLSILEHVNNNTVNRGHLEALQTVYPDLHQEMIQKAQEHLGAMKMKGIQLPYGQRVALAKLTATPLDSTMTQPNMQAIINSSRSTQSTQQGAQNKASGAELNQINKVNQLSETPGQARQIQKLK